MTQTIFINDQIQLTPFLQEDQANLVRYLNDAEVHRNTLTIPYPYTEQDAQAWLVHTEHNTGAYGMPVNWAVRHHHDGLIGGIGLFVKKGLQGHLDELGYWLAQPYRGRGWMSEVVRVFSDWQFEQRPALLRLEGIVFAHNPASVRVLEKAGYDREGYARKFIWKNGEAIDAILMAKIRG